MNLSDVLSTIRSIIGVVCFCRAILSGEAIGFRSSFFVFCLFALFSNSLFLCSYLFKDFSRLVILKLVPRLSW